LFLSFLAGQPVASSGELTVKNEVLKAVSSRSGHYQPRPSHQQQFFDKLIGDGIDMNKIDTSKGF